MEIEVFEITWERAWLFLKVRQKEGARLPGLRQAVLTDGRGCLGAFLSGSRGPERAGEDSSGPEGTQTLSLNVTNAGNDRCLAPGTYGLWVSCGEEERIPVLAAEALRGAGEQVFSYEKGSGRYALRTGRGPEGRLEIRVTEEQKSPGGLRGLYRRSMRTFLRGEYGMLRLLRRRKRNRKQVLFMTEQNPSLGGNLLAVKTRLEERGTAWRTEESCRVTVTASHLGFGSWVKTVGKLAGADVLFLDDHAPILDWLKLDPDTELVQLWHGGVGFKSSGYTRWGHGGSLPPFSAYRQISWGVCASERDREVFSELWGISREKILPAGMPRLDRLLDPAAAAADLEKARRLFPQTEGKKVLLYAPTYRGENRRQAHFPYEALDFSAWHEACGSDWVVLLKMHPWVQEPPPVPEEYRDRIIDAGAAGSAMELFGLADLLVTDYSSAIYEFSALRKPMLFYAFDLEAYRGARGIHGDYREMAPGKVAESFPELLEAIRRGDFEEERAEAYRAAHFDSLKPDSTDRVIDWLLMNRLPERYRAERAAAEAKGRRIGCAMEEKSQKQPF